MTPPAGRWTTTLNFPFASGMRRTSLSLWTRARKDTAPRAPRRGPSESLLVVRCDLRPKDHVERSRPCRTIEIRGAHPPRGRHDTTRDTVALARLRHHRRSGRRKEYFAQWPYVRNLVAHNSLYNYGRMQDVWLDK